MWRSLFPKVLRWCVSALALIWGCGFLTMFHYGAQWGLFPALMCFGVIYWLYRTREDFPKETAIASLAILPVTMAAAWKLDVDIYPLSGGFFTAWSGWALLLGLPVIAYVCWKYD